MKPPAAFAADLDDQPGDVAGCIAHCLVIGAAATSRIPLGIVIVGGSLFPLVLLFLLFLPCIHSFPLKKKKSEMELLDDTESKRA